MLRNFFVYALRNLFREHVYAAINIGGLVVGLVSALFLFLWIADEIRYDRFHQGYERIYQVLENQTYEDGSILTYDGTPAPLSEKLKRDFAEVEQTCRITWEQRLLISSPVFHAYQEGVYTDSSFFNLFTFPLVEGDLHHLLSDNSSIVISRKMADLYFPNGNALGNIIRVDNSFEAKVTGVFEDMPNASSIRSDFILPFDLYGRRSSLPMAWGNHNVFTYVKLHPDQSGQALSDKIKNILKPTYADDQHVEVFLFPLTDWRLWWNFENGVQRGGRIYYVVAFGIIALFILIAACVNFMNLATARAARRAREVGIRKVAGASRQSLIQQFLTESLLLSFISLGIALIGVHLLTPLFNSISGKTLQLDYTDPMLLTGLLVIPLFTGLLAGSYPALFLSSFRPASVLKGNLFSSQKGVGIRKVLVVFQFTLSVFLVVSSIVINQQVNYILTSDIGFEKDHILRLQPRPGSLKNFAEFKEELLRHSVIQSVGRGYDHPMLIFNNDMAWWEELPAGTTYTIQSTECDADYLTTLGIKLTAGRYFSGRIASDSTAFVINEALAGLMGSDVIGKKLRVYQNEGYVVGVVKDFHHNDYYSTIDPLVFLLGQERTKPMEVFINYVPGKEKEATTILNNVYKRFEPDFPLEYTFLEEDAARLYKKEIMTGNLSLCFTIILILISLLGLFGLTLYTTERRTKEIGVRKVLGAPVPVLILMLCKDFVKPVVISLFISFPLAYYVMNTFLSQYRFHIDVTAGVFVVTALGMSIITIMTVFFQSRKAALTNPAETLRTE